MAINPPVSKPEWNDNLAFSSKILCQSQGTLESRVTELFPAPLEKEA